MNHDHDLYEACEVIRKARKEHDWDYIKKMIYEYAEVYTDSYVDRLLKWYLEDIDRVATYLDEAVKENLGSCSAYDVLFDGQFLYWVEVFSQAFDKVKEEEQLLEGG